MLLDGYCNKFENRSWVSHEAAASEAAKKKKRVLVIKKLCANIPTIAYNMACICGHKYGFGFVRCPPTGRCILEWLCTSSPIAAQTKNNNSRELENDQHGHDLFVVCLREQEKACSISERNRMC